MNDLVDLVLESRGNAKRWHVGEEYSSSKDQPGAQTKMGTWSCIFSGEPSPVVSEAHVASLKVVGTKLSHKAQRVQLELDRWQTQQLALAILLRAARRFLAKLRMFRARQNRAARLVQVCS